MPWPGRRVRLREPASWTLVSVWAWVSASTWPALALACPECTRNGSNNDFYWILGSMILLPFPTAAVVFFIIKRGEEDSL